MDWHTIAVFVLGAAAGALVMYLLRHRFNDTQALQRKVSDLQAELEDYRAQVDQHFERTSDLFQEVTRKYRSLHDHLAQGATGLTRSAKRLPSIELPEKALLPAQPEQDVDVSEQLIGDTDTGGPVDAVPEPEELKPVPEAGVEGTERTRETPAEEVVTR